MINARQKIVLAGERWMEYQYPIDYSWSTEEIVAVIKFFENVEKAYEAGVDREEMMKAYRRFKEIVTSIAEEKTICKEFEEVSGYSSYKAVKKAKESAPGEKIKL